jgi:peroxiredoxin
MKTFKNTLVLLFVIAIVYGCNEMNRQVNLIKHRRHIKFIESYPDSLESAHALSVMATTFGKKKTSELFSNLTQRVKDSEDGKMISKYLSINKDPGIGDHFIDFEMLSPEGETRKLSKFKGKVILLEFWASWCGPCQREMPNLKKVYEEFHNDGFEVFAVSFDEDKDSWTKAIEKGKLNWCHVSELKSIGNTAGLIYGVYGIPANFLINEDGIIIARDLRGDDLEKKLKKAMKRSLTGS